MAESQMQSFALVPYATLAGQAVRRIEGRVSRTPEGLLRVNYLLEGDLKRLHIPEPRTPRFADELWRHTCFELFIARQGEPHYREFNFSPSGEWAAYAFARYRERVAGDASAEPAAIDPRVTVRRSPGHLTLEALVHLAPRHAQARLVLGVSAVVENRDGPDPLSYWALSHPADKPDFHHPDAFVLEFDEIRN